MDRFFQGLVLILFGFTFPMGSWANIPRGDAVEKVHAPYDPWQPAQGGW